MQGSFPIIIAYDMKLMKPGCALLQPIYGGNINGFDLQRFGVDNWLLAPTDNIKPYTLHSQEELDKVITLTKEHSTCKK
jgi:hypothetical protein